MQESFELAINTLIRRAIEENGSTITHTEIANTLGISLEDFTKYYNSENTPADIFKVLREHYKRYLGNAIFVKSIETWELDEDEFEDEDEEML
ncbi:MAG: hypothetical protein JO154_12360 [Chitinophaga sp.]|uniref:hypothetical protein n=1 Tax=Chitinophaga sp. TaxID=1869181 RepID=UPI0025BE2C29|nr:hypothetical protein [Chitinophaga sp.]MBV8253393.1 hypothetical protein [Chitinophaga sp.]